MAKVLAQGMTGAIRGMTESFLPQTAPPRHTPLPPVHRTVKSADGTHLEKGAKVRVGYVAVVSAAHLPHRVHGQLGDAHVNRPAWVGRGQQVGREGSVRAWWEIACTGEGQQGAHQGISSWK